MINDFSLGKMIIDGISYTGDLKIIQGQVFPNWWRKKGHSVDIEDIRDILRAEPEFLIIGKGDPGLMQATEHLENILAQKGIKLIQETTPEAIAVYNNLIKQGTDASAGFHLFC